MSNCVLEDLVIPLEWCGERKRTSTLLAGTRLSCSTLCCRWQWVSGRRPMV